MARRRKGGRRKKRVVARGGKICVCKPVRASTRQYKRCIVAALKRTKITSPKQARKAFQKAAKQCRKKMGMAVRRRGGRRRKRSASLGKLRRAIRTGSLPRTVPPEIRRQIMGLSPSLF